MTAKLTELHPGAKCGWCLTGDHAHHNPGGPGWACSCPICWEPEKTQSRIQAARASRRSVDGISALRAAAQHARAMSEHPDTPAEHRAQWEQQALTLESRCAPPVTKPHYSTFEKGTPH